MNLQSLLKRSLASDFRDEADSSGALEAMYNPAIFVLSGVLIGMTLVDQLRETARARQFDTMLQKKLTDTVDELAQLRAEREARATPVAIPAGETHAAN